MSGVYIGGMEMPTSYCECFAFKSNASGQLFSKAKRIAFGKEDAEWLPKCTPSWCPLVPVPDHGRLMDKDAVNLQGGPYEYDEWCEWALDQYMNAPIILPADKEGK